MAQQDEKCYSNHMIDHTNNPPATVVLYHDECTDGFGAAYAAWTVLRETARYIPVRHGKPLPGGLANEAVLLLDFCYPRAVMETLRQHAASVQVIDHHATGHSQCGDLPGCHFDMKHSGATLAWAYFHPGEPVPRLMRAIEDSDLERYALPGTRSLILALRKKAMTFETWHAIASDHKTMSSLLMEGKLLETSLVHSAKLIAKTAVAVKVGGVRGLCASTSWEFAADAATAMAAQSGTFGLAWYHEGETVRCSWRSVGGVSAEDLSGLFGGGGHPHSAGSQHGEKEFWALLDKIRDRSQIEEVSEQ
jgi:oligoribonuclease NrnB/cAMP/cGMP phosphodiesterase (DHH superfamily)